MKKLLILIGAGLSIAAMAFVAKTVNSALHGDYSLSDIQWPLVALSMMTGLAGYIVAPMLWIRLLRMLRGNDQEKIRVVPLYLTYTRSWFARYLPGNFWNLGGRALLASRLGIPARPLALSMLLEAFLLRIVPAIVGGVLIISIVWNPIWGGLLLPFAVIIVATCIWITLRSLRINRLRSWHLLRWLTEPISKETPPIRFRDALVWVILYGMFTIAGFGFFGLLVIGVLDISLGQAIQVTGIWALASVAGSFVVISPAAFGARDGAVLGALSSLLPLQEAALVVASFRIATVILDLIFVGGG